MTLGLAEIARSCDEADKNSDAMLAASLSEGGAFGCENDCRLKSDEFIHKYADRIVDISDISQSTILNNPLQIDMGIRQSAGFPMFSGACICAKSANTRRRKGLFVCSFQGKRALRFSF